MLFLLESPYFSLARYILRWPHFSSPDDLFRKMCLRRLLFRTSWFIPFQYNRTSSRSSFFRSKRSLLSSSEREVASHRMGLLFFRLRVSSFFPRPALPSTTNPFRRADHPSLFGQEHALLDLFSLVRASPPRVPLPKFFEDLQPFPLSSSPILATPRLLFFPEVRRTLPLNQVLRRDLFLICRRSWSVFPLVFFRQ